MGNIKVTTWLRTIWPNAKMSTRGGHQLFVTEVTDISEKNTDNMSELANTV